MAIETEKKFILSSDQREQVLNNLNELGAKYIREDFEENTLYGGGILSVKGAVLRIRKVGNKTILTYKQRIENTADVKQQIEYETVVEKFEEMEMIVESLGFEKVLVYEKRRQKWHFRAVEVVLDEVPFGQYMEIEGSVKAIAEAEMLLNIKNLVVENETYPQLTQRFGVQKGKITEARF
jgi:adenylate cyclase class 2